MKEPRQHTVLFFPFVPVQSPRVKLKACIAAVSDPNADPVLRRLANEFKEIETELTALEQRYKQIEAQVSAQLAAKCPRVQNLPLYEELVKINYKSTKDKEKQEILSREIGKRLNELIELRKAAFARDFPSIG